MTSAPKVYRALDSARDLEPHSVDPLFKYLRQRETPEAVVFLASFFGTALLAVLASALTKDSGFYPVEMGRSTLEDASTLFVQPKANTVGTERMPLLRDVNSLIAWFTIACAPYFVYSLFNCLSKLHSQLAKNGCLEVSDDVGSDDLEARISALNTRFDEHSRWLYASLVAFAIALALAYINRSIMNQGAFSFLFEGGEDPEGLMAAAVYNNWWARPGTPGHFAWIILGTIGLYYVYVEAVVGFRYVAFIVKNRKTFRFRASDFDSDGYFGWQVVRRSFAFMTAGIATGTMSTIPIFIVLRPGIAIWILVLFLVIYMAMIVYVSAASALVLSRHIERSRAEKVAKSIERVRELRDKPPKSNADFFELELLHRDIEYQRSIPRFPVAHRFTALAFLATLISVVGSVAGIISSI